MTQHTDFYTRLDDLQQRVATARSAVQAAAAESDAQLRQRIDRAQADLDQSVENARQQVSQAADSARAKWAQLKADAAAKMSDVKANIDKRTRQMDAKVAAKDADWAEADAAEALDFADWAVENAQLRCSTPSTPAPTPTSSPRPPPTRSPPSDWWPRAPVLRTTLRRGRQERLTPCLRGTTQRRSAMTNDVKTPDPLRDTIRDGARDASAASWWLVALGALWIWFGMFVLSYQVGSLVAVATFVGTAFLFGGITQLVVASRVPAMRWLSIVGGILGIAAGIVTFVWPDITLYVVSIMVAWYLIVFGTIHIVNALAGPKLPWWWTGLLLGISELVLGVWAARSWERSLVTLVTLVGVWAICRGVNEIFAGFTLRQVGKQADRLVA